MRKATEIEITPLKHPDDGMIPNHPFYPLLHYKNVIEENDDTEKRLSDNNWRGIWKGGVAPYHHYHSITHEVIVVDSGTARLHLGGEEGTKVKVEAGDVAVIPAGFGHKNIDSSPDFAVYGAYPDGKEYDFCYGKKEEREEKLKNIRNVPIPDNDPVFGADGPLFKYWKDE